MSDPFLKRCHECGLVVDANTLNIVIVGMKDKNIISDTDSTNKYCAEDFGNILKLFEYSKKIVISPYILPEVSNTLPLDYRSKKGKKDIDMCPRFLNETIALLGMDKVDEGFKTFKEIIKSENICKFGITDVAIIDLASNGYAVLTDDGPLVGYLLNSGCLVKKPGELMAQRIASYF